MNDPTDPRLAVFDPSALGRLQWIMDWWQRQGLRWVNLPWWVPESCIAHTRPPNVCLPEPATHEGPLVASGEQAFLWLDAEDRLPSHEMGYIGWTPCFRHEPVYDATHHHGFLKAELFIPLGNRDPRAQLDFLMARVEGSWRDCAQAEGRPLPTLDRAVTGPLSQDWLLRGVELGSYGVRERMKGKGLYLYGTALAEPRWSQTWPLPTASS
jgi:hypothetical protein